MDIHVGWLAKTYIHNLCADTKCRLDDWLIDADGKRESRESVLTAQLDNLLNESSLFVHSMWNKVISLIDTEVISLLL